MSAPKYWITIRVGELNYSAKLKSRLGDHEGFKREVNDPSFLTRLLEGLEEKYGGLDKAESLWYKQYSEALVKDGFGDGKRIDMELEGQIHSILGNVEERDFRQIQAVWVLVYKGLLPSFESRYNYEMEKACWHMVNARLLSEDYRSFLRSFSDYLQESFPDKLDRAKCLSNFKTLLEEAKTCELLTAQRS